MVLFTNFSLKNISGRLFNVAIKIILPYKISDLFASVIDAQSRHIRTKATIMVFLYGAILLSIDLFDYNNTIFLADFETMFRYSELSQCSSLK